MDLGTLLSLLGGFVLLVGGGELLVRGASGLAAAIGMSPLVVGLTVVAFATSAPELAVTLAAIAGGSPDLAVGNVVGSNIANVLLVLGISAVMAPLAVKSQMVRIDVPVMVAMSVLLLVLSLDGQLSTWNCALLLTCLVGYIVMSVVLGRRETKAAQASDPQPVVAQPDQPNQPEQPEQPEQPRRLHPAVNTALLCAGVGLLVLGADLLVSGATAIATALGMPEMVIGLTIVAVGTSLPELATSIIATIRGERDLAVGNAVGSNIFNIGAVLGLGGLVSSTGIPVSDSAVNFDIPVMVGVSILLLPIVYTGFAIARWEGLLFLGLYGAYTTYLLLNAADHQRLPAFSAVMIGFVLPMVAIAISLTVGFDAGKKVGRQEALEAQSEADPRPAMAQGNPG